MPPQSIASSKHPFACTKWYEWLLNPDIHCAIKPDPIMSTAVCNCVASAIRSSSSLAGTFVSIVVRCRPNMLPDAVWSILLSDRHLRECVQQEIANCPTFLNPMSLVDLQVLRDMVEADQMSAPMAMSRNGLNAKFKPMFIAVRAGRLDIVRRLIRDWHAPWSARISKRQLPSWLNAAGPFSDHFDDTVWDVRILACLFGHVDIARFVDNSGILYNRPSATAIVAAHGGSMECFNYSTEIHLPNQDLDLVMRECADTAARRGHVSILAHIERHYPTCMNTALVGAIESHQFDIMNYLMPKIKSFDVPWSIKAKNMCMYAAVVANNAQCLMDLREMGCDFKALMSTPVKVSNEHLGNYRSSLMVVAAEHGCALAMAHLCRCHDGQLTAELLATAAENGHLPLMKWMCSQGCPMNADVFAQATHNKNLDVLTWLSQVNCPWDESVTANAAGQGNLSALKFLHKCHCPWSETAVLKALEHCHADCLTYLLDHGCPWGQKTVSKLRDYCWRSHAPCAEILLARMPANKYVHIDGIVEVLVRVSDTSFLRTYFELGGTWKISGGGSFDASNSDVIQFALTHGLPDTHRTHLCEEFAKKGQFEMLKFAHKHRCPLPDQLKHWWSSSNNNDSEHIAGIKQCVKYLLRKGVPVASSFIADVACHGHADLVEFILEGNYLTTPDLSDCEKVLEHAGCRGHVECVRILHAHIMATRGSYHWTHGKHALMHATAAAARGGFMDLLKFVHENGAPCEHRTVICAILGGHVDCLSYALIHGTCDMDAALNEARKDLDCHTCLQRFSDDGVNKFRASI